MFELVVWFGNGYNIKLSVECKFWMREQVIQKLVCVYCLNEIVCSVVIVKYFVLLEGFVELVFQWIFDDFDVNYVYFFYEKIFMWRVVENISLDFLDKIILVKFGELENWCIRVVVKMMKGDYEGVVYDFIFVLMICQIYVFGYQFLFLILNVLEEQFRFRVKLLESEQLSFFEGNCFFCVDGFICVLFFIKLGLY